MALPQDPMLLLRLAGAMKRRPWWRRFATSYDCGRCIGMTRGQAASFAWRQARTRC